VTRTSESYRNLLAQKNCFLVFQHNFSPAQLV